MQIVNAVGEDAGELSLKRRRSLADERRPLGSQPLVFQVEPDSYAVAVRLQNADVTPSDPVMVDLFEDRTVVFTKVSPFESATPFESVAVRTEMPTSAMMDAAEAVDVDIVVPTESELWLRHVETGTEHRFGAS